MSKHSSNFKARVALDAIREVETLAELGKRHNIHPRQIQVWKAEALKQFESLFVGKKILDTKNDDKIDQLERKVGQLVIENDFLKKSLSRLPG